MMCCHTQVTYACIHQRILVRSWCKLLHSVESGPSLTQLTGTGYQTTYKPCPPNIVALENRLNEKCGMNSLNDIVSLYFADHVMNRLLYTEGGADRSRTTKMIHVLSPVQRCLVEVDMRVRRSAQVLGSVMGDT